MNKTSIFNGGGMCAAAAVAVLAAQPQVPPSVAFGTRHAVAMRNNGDVLAWGDNVMCQVGRGTRETRDASALLVMRNAKAIAAAAEHTLVLTRSGEVYGWGMNAEGALGVGNTYDQCQGPALVTSLSGKNIVQIAAGHNFTMALSANGDLYCAGANDFGQCPTGTRGRSETFVPVVVPGLTGQVAAIESGSFHTLALMRDGRLFAFGRGREGQLGDGKSVNGAGYVAALTDVASLAAGTWHSVALRRDGSVWSWGHNAKSQLCDGSAVNRAIPVPIAMTAPGKIARVAAGGHTTLLHAVDGALYVCGDNFAGSLGVSDAVVATPAKIPGATTTHPVVAAGGNHSAFSPDGCSLRIAGDNDQGVVTPTRGERARGFTARVNLSLCGAVPASPLPDVVNPEPRGGASGCWTPRVEEDDAANPKLVPLRNAMLTVETLLKKNEAFLGAPEPSRIRSAISASDGSARIHVKVVPERKADGTRLWTGECDVIPQVDRIGGAIAQLSVFFNTAASDVFQGAAGQIPKRTGTVGGFPEYNGWVLISANGRLPWIPQTVADRLDVEGTKRERALAEYRKTVASWKTPDEAATVRTYEMLKKTDPAGAEKFLASSREQDIELRRQQQEVAPLTIASLERRLQAYRQYRGAFSIAQLQSPAVFGDPTGEGKRRLDARLAELRALSPAEQVEVDQLTQEGRALERQAQAEVKNKNQAAAARLRTQANEFGLKARAIRQRHAERAAPLITEALAEHDLNNIKPGPAEQALGVKPDPSFPNPGDPTRIQLIAVALWLDPDARQTARRAWQTRAKETFDYAALAALLK